MCTNNCTEMRIAMGIIITHKQMEFWKRNITAGGGGGGGRGDADFFYGHKFLYCAR